MWKRSRGLNYLLTMHKLNTIQYNTYTKNLSNQKGIMPVAIQIQRSLIQCNVYIFSPSCYPSSCDMFWGCGEGQRHVGIAVGSIWVAVARWGAVRGFGEGVSVCARAKHKAAKGMAVGQEHDRLHQLSQRPALFPCFQQHLGVESKGQISGSDNSPNRGVWT